MDFALATIHIHVSSERGSNLVESQLQYLIHLFLQHLPKKNEINRTEETDVGSIVTTSNMVLGLKEAVRGTQASHLDMIWI